MAWAVQNSILESHTAGSSDNSGKLADDTVRKFADELATKVSDGTTVELTVNDSTNGSGLYTVTANLEAGVYLFVDGAAGDGTVTTSIPMIVYSGTVSGNAIIDPVVGTNTVDVKNEVTTVSKTVDGSVPGIGDTKTYTITSKIPNWIGKDLESDPAPYFTFTDTPTKGQTVNFNSIAIKVDGVSEPLNKGMDYTVQLKDAEGQLTDVSEDETLRADDATSFVMDLTNYMKTAALASSGLIGKTITMTYNVTINSDAVVVDAVTNTVDVDNDGSAAQDATDPTDSIVQPATLTFTKVKASDGTALAGAEFSLTKNGQMVNVVEKEEGTAGAYVIAENQTVGAPNTTTVLVSDEDGNVTVEGLGNGEYTVAETEAPEGYMQMTPSFKAAVSSTNGESGMQASVAYSEVSDVFDLITIDDNKVTVKNVQNVAQLPLTGAAGTGPVHRGRTADRRRRSNAVRQIPQAARIARRQSWH